MTITHILHKYHPRFLELDARWVDALLETEEGVIDRFARRSLMFLFKSYELDDFDFKCKRFRELLQRQRDLVDNCDRTVLMYLCRYSP